MLMLFLEQSRGHRVGDPCPGCAPALDVLVTPALDVLPKTEER